MNKMELFEAVGEIDGDLIARCENEMVHTPKRIWVRWLSVAACLTVLCLLSLPVFKQPPGNPISPGINSRPETPSNALLCINRLKQEPSFQNSNISLNVNDFVPMTDSEFLNYYGVSLSINKALPALKLQPQDPAKRNGIFKSSSRGIYYDSHTFVFASDANTKRLEVTLSKTAYYPGLIVGVDESNAQLKQSELGGFAVTIFRYTKEDGSICCYTEFLNNKIAYGITSYNLSQEEYAAVLTSVIADNADTKTNPSGAEDTHTVTGTVNAVDDNANLICISVGDGAFSTLRVYLPKGEAKSCSLGDRVEIRYVGNPITLCTIWAQQLKSISAVKD